MTVHAYVYPTHRFCSCLGEQNGPLVVVPLIWHAVSSLFGIPWAVALAVARYTEAVYVEVDVPSTIVALTPSAMYAVVLVTVNAGVLTKSVTVWSPTSLADGVTDAVADDAEPELVEEVIETSIAVAADDLEAGVEAAAEVDAE